MERGGLEGNGVNRGEGKSFKLRNFKRAIRNGGWQSERLKFLTLQGESSGIGSLAGTVVFSAGFPIPTSLATVSASAFLY